MLLLWLCGLILLHGGKARDAPSLSICSPKEDDEFILTELLNVQWISHNLEESYGLSVSLLESSDDIIYDMTLLASTFASNTGFYDLHFSDYPNFMVTANATYKVRIAAMDGLEEVSGLVRISPPFRFSMAFDVYALSEKASINFPYTGSKPSPLWQYYKAVRYQALYLASEVRMVKDVTRISSIAVKVSSSGELALKKFQLRFALTDADQLPSGLWVTTRRLSAINPETQEAQMAEILPARLIKGGWFTFDIPKFITLVQAFYVHACHEEKL
jgi:hypothetical protein